MLLNDSVNSSSSEQEKYLISHKYMGVGSFKKFSIHILPTTSLSFIKIKFYSMSPKTELILGVCFSFCLCVCNAPCYIKTKYNNNVELI